MKELIDYQNLIEELASYAYTNNILPQIEFLKTLKNFSNDEYKEKINKAMILRRELGILDNEVQNFHAILNAGSQIYTDFNDNEAAFICSCEISDIIRKKLIKAECAKYNKKDFLFKQNPELLKKINSEQELIDISEAQIDIHSRIFEMQNTRLKMSNKLNPGLIDYLKNKYPNNPLYIRIDKNAFGKKASELITESVIRTEKSHWYKEMKIYNSESKKGTYEYPLSIIDLGFPKIEADEIIKKIKFNDEYKYQLQTLFKRDNNNSLSGSIEELKIAKDNMLIARHLHLTSDSPIGTNWDEGILSHIDGAINVYFDKNIKKRLKHHLDFKVKADCRTHLFRIDNIPITELLPIAKLFFKGLALVEEWESDSFST